MQSNQKSVRIHIVDDHTIVCQGISRLLHDCEDFNVVGSSANFVLDDIISSAPDVIIMDVKLIEENGIDATRVLKKHLHQVKVLILSGYCNSALIASAIKAGASGYLPKAVDPETLREAIREVTVSDDFYVPPNIKSQLTEIMDQLALCPADYALTTRELDVLVLIALEASTKEIAARLNISEKTVRNHKSNIMQKLDLNSAAGLIKYAYHMALI